MATTTDTHQAKGTETFAKVDSVVSVDGTTSSNGKLLLISENGQVVGQIESRNTFVVGASSLPLFTPGEMKPRKSK